VVKAMQAGAQPQTVHTPS